MNFIEHRRRMLIAGESSVKGQIIITTANATNYVEVDGVRYTSPTVVPYRDETNVTMPLATKYPGFTLNNSVSEAYGRVEELEFDLIGLSDTDLNFVALPNYIYYLDAVNYDVIIEKPDDDLWDGVIFTSSKKAYPCVSMKSTTSDAGNLFLTEGIYYWLQAISDSYENNITYGPIDVTNFKTLYFESSGNTYLPKICNQNYLDNSGSYEVSTWRGNYRLYVGTSSDSSNIANVTKDIADGDGAVTSVDLSNVTGEIYIRVSNIYTNQSVAIKEMKLLKDN